MSCRSICGLSRWPGVAFKAATKRIGEKASHNPKPEVTRIEQDPALVRGDAWPGRAHAPAWRGAQEALALAGPRACVPRPLLARAGEPVLAGGDQRGVSPATSRGSSQAGSADCPVCPRGAAWRHRARWLLRHEWGVRQCRRRAVVARPKRTPPKAERDARFSPIAQAGSTRLRRRAGAPRAHAELVTRRTSSRSRVSSLAAHGFQVFRAPAAWQSGARPLPTAAGCEALNRGAAR